MTEKIIPMKVDAPSGRKPEHAAIPGGLRLTEFAEQAGISISYASQLLSTKEEKRRSPTIAMAVDIYQRTGLKLGILAGATRGEIEALLRMLMRNGWSEAA
jgi:transcriptional regulator with XRE-family HTH domain